MARITIEDCMEHVPNRFQLVRMASIRAKQLKKGARPLLGVEGNKDVVMSLREIAAGLVKPGDTVAEPEAVRAATATPVPAAKPSKPLSTESSAAELDFDSPDEPDDLD
jgi:DNA-directed RNA polymerase subunit omega